MDAHLQFALLLTNFFFVWVFGATPIPNKQLLGIDPQDLSYYKSNVIKCKDGSKKFNKELLNDEFCDCPDGTDEPGTSACPEGKFYCQNAGHIPMKIFSSRVNDGICDCCDGSDEYDSNANCTNACWEAGKAARGKLKKKIETFKEGVILRKELVEKANQAYAKDEADLEKLKSDEKVLKELVEKLREQKERIDKLEEEERLRKEKEEKRLREEEEKSKELEKKAEEETQHYGNHEQDGSIGSVDFAVESGNDNKFESKTATSQAVEEHVGEGHDDTLESSDDISEVGEISPNEIPKQDHDDFGTTEELSREELGRLVASRWTGEGADQTTDKIGNVEEDQMNQEQDPSVGHEHQGYTSETDDDRAKDDDDDDDDDGSFEDDRDAEFEDDHAGSEGSYIPDEYEKPDSTDTKEASSSSWLDKIQQTVQNVLQAFNFFKTPVNVSDATHIRKEYDETSSKLSKVQSRISSLTEKLKRDFGKEKEFYFFHGQCFESKQNKYVYKICPFKQASQDEGYSSTRLGSWDNFEESYRVMVFSHGQNCWNGPDRSLKVRLRCGLKNEVSEVDEPSRCEYVALMSTPAVCLEDKLKELEKKLEQMNTREPQSHDEL